MPNYEVKQGDHLSSIAHDLGFVNFNPIWNHPNNAQLKSSRVNPNVLFPGDELFIPEIQLKSYDRPCEQTHRFKITLPKLKLRVILHGIDGKPLANVKCTLEVEGESTEVTSKSDGLIEQTILPTDKNARLVFKDPDFPFAPQIPIKIGHLDPIDTEKGQIVRLTHLGYFLGDPDNPDPADFLSAVEEFQCDNGLQVDGKCGPTTRAKLKDAHGC